MARQQQRYIEPDEIYTDMARGSRERIPREFPYSWNPVNGYTAYNTARARSSQGYGDATEWATDSVGGLGAGFLEDAFSNIVSAVTETGQKTAEQVVGDTKKSAEERAAQGIEELLRGGPGQALLAAVEKKAAEGVTAVVKDNAPNLIMLAVAGGAVGGALSAKLGKTGTVLALLVAGWAGVQLLNAKVPVKK
jgi:hypothetical protein